ncbi:hypothetical protein COOONC_14670 [Cooperia oncophora]
MSWNPQRACLRTRLVNPAADYLPKAASTSSVNKVIRTKDGGRLRVANVYTWGVESDDEILDARLQVNGVPDSSRLRAKGLSPQAIRRNEMQLRESRDEYIDERQAYALGSQPRRPSDAAVPTTRMAVWENLRLGRRMPHIGSRLLLQRLHIPHSNGHALPPPPVPQHQEKVLSPVGTRRTETIIDYEKKKQGPPVVSSHSSLTPLAFYREANHFSLSYKLKSPKCS